MISVLFVDDEPNVRDALRRQLRPWREQLDMVFADGGAAALDELTARPFDAIVSDIRMPGMDGVELLTRVKDEFPDVVRVVLSGHVDDSAPLKLLPIAHQVLAKPCDPVFLREVITRLGGIRSLLSHPRLREVVGELSTLPSLPRTYLALTRALSEQDSRLTRIAGLIEQDVAMTAKVLQLVNSAFFALRNKVVSVESAVLMLGFETLKSLVLAVEVLQNFHHLERLQGFSFDEFQRHVTLTATLARRLGSFPGNSGELFTAALLHDVGKLVLASRLSGSYGTLITTARRQQRTAAQAEREALGVSHAEVGGYTLGVWGLPPAVVEAVAFHHDPKLAPEGGRSAATVLHLANALAHDAISGGPISRRVDLEHLEAMGLIENLPRWREMAAQVAQMSTERSWG